LVLELQQVLEVGVEAMMTERHQAGEGFRSIENKKFSTEANKKAKI
jgi:hypothetical protein